MILRVGMGNLYLKQLRTNEPLVLRHVELLLADLEHQGNAELAVLVQAADQTSPSHVAIVEGLELIDVKALHVLSPRGMLNAHRPGTGCNTDRVPLESFCNFFLGAYHERGPFTW